MTRRLLRVSVIKRYHALPLYHVHRAARVRLRGVICLTTLTLDCKSRIFCRFGVVPSSNWAFLGVGVSSDGYRSVIGSNIVHAVSTPESQMREKVGARSPGEPGHTVPVRHRGSTLYRYIFPAPPGAESFYLSIYFVHLREGSPRGALAASEARGETTLPGRRFGL